MKVIFTFVISFGVIFILSGCAGPYRTLNVRAMNFQGQAVQGQKVQFSYLYDIQHLTENKRYSKKERKHGYAAVGLKITNYTDHAITITRDNLIIRSNGNRLSPIDIKTYVRDVHQTSASYLLYGLLGPWSYETVETPSGGSQTKFHYLPIFLAVGLVNLIVAESANAKHRETLTTNDIFGQKLDPGVMMYGIVLLPLEGYPPLSFELEE